jgi:hypothetical protein
MNRRILIALAASIPLTLLGAQAMRAPAAAQVDGRIESFAYVSATDDAGTSSTALVSMPDMLVNINLRTTGGAALIMFCGKSAPSGGPALPNDVILVEAQVDGLSAEPGTVILDSEVIGEVAVFETHCFNWAMSDLPRGLHTVEMLYSSLSGNQIRIQERSLSVLYR